MVINFDVVFCSLNDWKNVMFSLRCNAIWFSHLASSLRLRSQLAQGVKIAVPQCFNSIISDGSEYQVPAHGDNKSVYFRTEEAIANTPKLLLLHLGDIFLSFEFINLHGCA